MTAEDLYFSDVMPEFTSLFSIMLAIALYVLEGGLFRRAKGRGNIGCAEGVPRDISAVQDCSAVVRLNAGEQMARSDATSVRRLPRTQELALGSKQLTSFLHAKLFIASENQSPALRCGFPIFSTSGSLEIERQLP